MTSAPRRILLVDCDMYFVQVARLEDPEGAGRIQLLLVGGSRAGRGVITSADYSARAFGVRSGMPTAQALRLCPQATVVPVPRDACSRISSEIRTVLERFAPTVEAASIDEFYMDLSGTETLYRGEPLEATAERIRLAVKAETQIAVSIGGGTQRMVAKLAAGLAKPAGVRIVPAGAEADFMRAFELADIPGVGPVLAERLRTFGLRTVPDILPIDEATLKVWLGDAGGHWLWECVRGIDSSPVNRPAKNRSISREETFPRDLREDADLELELHRLAARVAADLRAARVTARTVTVKLKDADFQIRSASRTLPDPIESDRAVYVTALDLLRTLRQRRRTAARLIGVSLSQLGAPAGAAQFTLFEPDQPAETPRDRKLSHALDDLRERFGDRAVRPGTLLDPVDPPT